MRFSNSAILLRRERSWNSHVTLMERLNIPSSKFWDPLSLSTTAAQESMNMLELVVDALDVDTLDVDTVDAADTGNAVHTADVMNEMVAVVEVGAVDGVDAEDVRCTMQTLATILTEGGVDSREGAVVTTGGTVPSVPPPPLFMYVRI